MSEVILLNGGNIGDTAYILASANADLQDAGCIIIASSRLYRTAPWGKEDQQDFLNQALIIKTEMLPIQLLYLTQSIEQKYGRERSEKWGERTLDIDIIFYDDIILNTPILTIPHPLMQERNFVLRPIMEIAPEKLHPVFHTTIRELYIQSPDNKKVYLQEEE